MYFSLRVTECKTPHKATTILIFIPFTFKCVSFFLLLSLHSLYAFLNVSHKTLLSVAELREINELFCRFAMASAFYSWINDASAALSFCL